MENISFGGGCINDTMVHIATHSLPFGGVGDSGMGSYHGKLSFDTFTHMKSILVKSNKLDIKLRYAPYKNNLNLLKKILK
jgi:aldehyde dehydrogenase (NAD+)